MLSEHCLSILLNIDMAGASEPQARLYHVNVAQPYLSPSEQRTSSLATLPSSSIPIPTIINTGSGISAGALAGGVVGGLAVGMIISSAVTFFVLRRLHKTGATTSNNDGKNNNVPLVNRPQPPNAHIVQKEANLSPETVTTEAFRNSVGASTAFYLSRTAISESGYAINNQVSPSTNTGVQSIPVPPEEQQQQQRQQQQQQQQQQHLQSESMPIYSIQTSQTTVHTQTEVPAHMMPQFQAWSQQSAQHYPQHVAELDPNARQAGPPAHPGHPAQ
ncbi:uncharacterized protein CTHT_0012720 [Thermochaetoides thermophila DSM 1495]|uniref:Uncharacterized protein n=1 Tax=Chaetomium thermophilum (strain DSM 1495 / CBS 144.50 / IMI 039719) TaxID=759272 RepID=G0S187_CHATD|nr:hypothetical protein CTHT_0012720 [Thermochaetoides thermophila DSM 1495]EGS22797.1 hypothetical protein CTHT_0012720 [Thermochaetoides thermophila DSM 1495]